MWERNVSLEYVREYYGVPAEIGRRVTVYGKPGIISADRGHYIGVTFTRTSPTWSTTRTPHPKSPTVSWDVCARSRAPSFDIARISMWQTSTRTSPTTYALTQGQ